MFVVCIPFVSVKRKIMNYNMFTAKNSLRRYAEILGVSVNASQEEIKNAYDSILERHRNGNRIHGDFEVAYWGLRDRKKCEECKEFGVSVYMKVLWACPFDNKNYYFCQEECLNLHQSRTSAIQSIINKLQQTRVSFQDLYQAGGLAFIDLFEIDNCQCEHPGMTLQDYTNH